MKKSTFIGILSAIVFASLQAHSSELAPFLGEFRVNPSESSPLCISKHTNDPGVTISLGSRHDSEWIEISSDAWGAGFYTAAKTEKVDYNFESGPQENTYKYDFDGVTFSYSHSKYELLLIIPTWSKRKYKLRLNDDGSLSYTGHVRLSKPGPSSETTMKPLKCHLLRVQ